ncbi:hypothetical protein [Larkinella terrae]|uniref:Uncharacterized protein n=1 Tax=Larkinella terrae TaxID=2025311 RepID=A0A7K0EJG2_9BACT|nr:hypothetical protein [Larkinella terrae]MRS61905.1 hypothetical protein [Larkinella terrae]
MLRPACLPSLFTYLQQGGIAPHQLGDLLAGYSAEVQEVISAQINHYEQPTVWIEAKTWQETVDAFTEALLSDTEPTG